MEERTRYLDIDFQIRLLTEKDFEKLTSFSCGVAELDNFFRSEIRECVNYHYLSGYCAFLNNDEIIAAFTLMNDALMITNPYEKEEFIDDLQFETRKDIVDFFSRQTSFPAINIGHLGTAIKYQGHGIGSAIIDLVAETFSNDKRTGCQFITVDSLNNPKTNNFYCQNSFSFQTNKDITKPTRRMYRIL